MGALADKVGGKTAGELIKAKDWNDLVAAVEKIGTGLETLSDSVDARFTTLNGRADALDARLTKVETAVGTLRTTLEALQQQFRRVTLQTSRSTFAIGELAEITARVTDLEGNLLNLADPATRPWVDFVTVWGQFRPAPGFTSIGGAGDRTVSVQVNAAGEARVLLRADHTEYLADEAEQQVATTLTTKVGPASKTVAQTILEAATPQDTGVQDAFHVLSLEYDRPDTPHLRNYVDTYYVKNPSQVISTAPIISFPTWRDYRSTILAVAKGDSNPVTAEPSLGACSLQVIFRDWIFPWIFVDYLPKGADLVPGIRDRVASKLGPDFGVAFDRVRGEVTDLVRDKGLVAKQRHYRAIHDALDTLTVANPPAYLNTLTRSIQDAVAIQQTVEYGQAAAIGVARKEAAFVAFTDAASRVETQGAAVRAEVTGVVQQQLDQVQKQVLTKVREEQQSFRADLLAEEGPIRTVERQVSSVAGTVGALRGLDASRVNEKLAFVNGLDARLAALERR